MVVEPYISVLDIQHLQALFVENFRGVRLPDTESTLPELGWVSSE
jgi:hypothetical protein